TCKMPCSSCSCNVIRPVSTVIEPGPPREERLLRMPTDAFVQPLLTAMPPGTYSSGVPPLYPFAVMPAAFPPLCDDPSTPHAGPTRPDPVSAWPTVEAFELSSQNPPAFGLV